MLPLAPVARLLVPSVLQEPCHDGRRSPSREISARQQSNAESADGERM
jgi:hypothetical protein